VREWRGRDDVAGARGEAVAAVEEEHLCAGLQQLLRVGLLQGESAYLLLHSSPAIMLCA
jgi:hypothetical protein